MMYVYTYVHSPMFDGRTLELKKHMFLNKNRSPEDQQSQGVSSTSHQRRTAESQQTQTFQAPKPGVL